MDDPLYRLIIEDEEKRKDVLIIFFRNYLKLIEKYSDFYTIDSFIYATVYRSKRFASAYIYKIRMYYRILKAIEIARIIGFKKYFRGISILFKMSSSWIEELLENDYSHIDMVATDINHRGKGYLNEMFKAILKDDEIYTIETHNLINVNVYEKYDFELVKKKKLENTDLIQYCMIRRLRK